MKIVTVCTGNTCRSPMAEALIQKKYPENEVISRGLFVPSQSPASENSRKAMSEIGIDISSHIARQLTEDDVRCADLVLTMTKAQSIRIKEVVPEAADKIFTLCEYAGENGEISDPFGGDLTAYKKCAADIQKCVEKIKL